MPLYQYEYLDPSRKKRMGSVEAAGLKEAKDYLRLQGVSVLSLKEKKRYSSKNHLKGEALLAFTMQLSQLVGAGVPLYESLTALEEQLRGEPYHPVVVGLCQQIRTGLSLSTAMETYPDSFDRLYRGMVASGEAVGALSPVLEKLSFFLSRSMKLKKQIGTALIYPAILGGFSLVVIAVLMGFVVPSLEGIFKDRKLNGFTQAILTLSYFFRTYWWVYLLLIIGGGAFAFFKIRSPEGRLWLERVVLKMPLLKTLAIQTAVARFCRTLGTLLQGGLNMIDSLRIARGIMHNVVLENEIKVAEGRIVEGQSLSRQLKKSAYFPPLVARMLAVGEESGTSVLMLNRVADMYEGEVEKTLDRVMAMAQPVILIVMGMVIGSVLLAILLPLTDVSGFSS